MYVKAILPSFARMVLLCVLLSAISPLSSARAQSAQPVQPDIGQAVLDALTATGQARVLITLRDPVALTAAAPEREAAVATTQDAVLAQLPATEFTLIHRYRNVPGLAAIITQYALDLLRADPRVSSIQIDEAGGAHLLVSVPALRADIVHTQLGITGQGVTAAVLDSGVDTSDPELAIVAQQCFTHSACQPGNTNTGASAQDDNGHGTNVAVILASNGSVTAPGFAPAAKLVAVKVTDASGIGFVSDWIAGLDWVRTHLGTLKVRVVNMSFGTATLYSGTCDAQQPLMASAVSQLVALNVVIFASTGNEGSPTSIASPACNTGVIAVGATYKGNVGRQPTSGTYNSVYGGTSPACFDSPTTLETITCFTNSSARMDIVAPGAPITTYGLHGSFPTFSGTSQAAPTAAGIAALMLQVDGAQTPAQIATRLKPCGATVIDLKNGLQFTRIDAWNTLVAKICTPAPDSTLPGATVTFTWSAGSGVLEYWLDVGTTPGGSNLLHQSQGTNLSGTVSGLPTTGQPVYVRLWSRFTGVWQQFNDYTYTAAGPPVDPLLAKTELLMGQWHFAYTIIIPFTDDYTLTTIPGTKNSQGGYFINGTDEFGNPVTAAYFPNDGDWALLDPGIIIDQFYVFYTDGTTILPGSCYYQINPPGSNNLSRCYALSGLKTGSAAAVPAWRDSSLKAIEEDARAQEAEQDTAPVSPDVTEKYQLLKSLIR